MIHVQNVTKLYGSKRAVDGISFAVNKGEVLGFLGPNGAGKSTTMRMVTGYTIPTAGKVEIQGHHVQENAVEAKKLIGYLPENAPAYTDMSVYGFLKFAGALRGLRGKTLREAIDRAVELCFLQPVLHQSVDTLSKGYLHRTCFAQSIIHDPPVLVLDEPTDGLDPNQKHEVRSLIRKMGETKAIVFSTHILEEVEAVCTRAIIIDRGKIVANGTPLELKNRSPKSGSVRASFRGAPAEQAEAELKKLDSVAEVERLKVDSDGASYRVLPKKSGQTGLEESIYQLAASHKWTLTELTREEGRLDEVFRSITLPEGAQTAAA
ncbi:MAG: ABC transporter ATP-binding protein [Verrucomicrobiales bacterium]